MPLTIIGKSNRTFGMANQLAAKYDGIAVDGLQLILNH